MFCINCGKPIPADTEVCPSCGFDMREEDTLEGVMQDLDVEVKTPEQQIPEDALVEALLQTQPVQEEQPVQELDLENILSDSYGMDEGLEDLTEEEIYPNWAKVPEEDYREEAQPRRKKGWVIACIVACTVLLLGLGAFFGIRYYQNTNTYERALAHLENREYEQALSLFMRLGDFKDSASYAAHLQEKLQAYQDAISDMKSGRFDGVEEVFTALGDFKDSQQMLSGGIRWYKAEYLLRAAQNRDKAGMALVSGVDETTEDYLVWVLMLMSAKEHYSQIPEYEDAAQKIQLCYLEAARVLALDGQMEAALEYKDMMDEATQQIFMAEYMELCADEAFLNALKTSLQARMELEQAENKDLKTIVVTEQGYIGRFQKLYFLDKDLQKLALSYMEGVYLQWISLDSQGRCAAPATWARGEHQRLQAVKALCWQYGFLADAANVADYYLDKVDAAQAQHQIHSSIAAQLSQAVEAQSLTAKYINDSGYAFNVTFTFTFYKEDAQVAQTTVTMAIGSLQEKTLRGKVPQEAYDRWSLSWEVFDVTGDGQVDITGLYAIYSMHMLQYESLFSRQDLEAAGRGDDAVELLADGTGTYTMNGETRQIQYQNGLLWFADAPQVQIPFQVSAGELTFTVDETEYIFKK